MSQLYDVVQKWDAMSTSVPQVVQRLVAVKELHEQGETSQTENAVHCLQTVEAGTLGKSKLLERVCDG